MGTNFGMPSKWGRIIASTLGVDPIQAGNTIDSGDISADYQQRLQLLAVRCGYLYVPWNLQKNIWA